jgi:tetratricopeptide (TPR) repeat protein
MALAVRAAEPEVFFRHYLECSIESLELMGSYDEVVDYCDRVIEHYRQHDFSLEQQSVAERDLAHIYQRRGAVLFKQGKRAEAKQALQQALQLQAELPLATTLLHWLNRNFHGDAARTLAEQRRHAYFSVRQDTVDATRATPLPAVAAVKPN